MSIRYPVPNPPRPVVALPQPQLMRSEFLPPAPAAPDTELPPLVMAPMTPPGWPRWQ